MQAIHLPSGETDAESALSINWDVGPPSLETLIRTFFPPWELVKTTHCPSGDMAGEELAFPWVSGFRLLPSISIRQMVNWPF